MLRAAGRAGSDVRRLRARGRLRSHVAAARLGMASSQWARAGSTRRQATTASSSSAAVPARAWLDMARLEIRRQAQREPARLEGGRGGPGGRRCPGQPEIRARRTCCGPSAGGAGGNESGRRSLTRLRDRQPDEAELWTAAGGWPSAARTARRGLALLDEADKRSATGLNCGWRGRTWLAPAKGRGGLRAGWRGWREGARSSPRRTSAGCWAGWPTCPPAPATPKRAGTWSARWPQLPRPARATCACAAAVRPGAEGGDEAGMDRALDEVRSADAAREARCSTLRARAEAGMAGARRMPRTRKAALDEARLLARPGGGAAAVVAAGGRGPRRDRRAERQPRAGHRQPQAGDRQGRKNPPRHPPAGGGAGPPPGVTPRPTRS